VISYILVILIFITPRTFYVGGPGGGGSRFLSRSGLLTGSGSSPVVGVGRRPLLQKIATVTVAISLTIASSDTFNVAHDQYQKGYTYSTEIVEDVVGSLEIRIVRIISDTFLWLAQVQTLIRLFPRHKEKVTIKWLGFAMVSFDTIFSILDSFVSQNVRTRPRSFQDAIPALNYLFELSISLIYASCVVYYSLSKRRFAFWHPKMRNVCLVALVSYMSILIPVVFFVLDISLPRLASWGEYIRWVGAAAASVVVWEWVERIEALERDERKDGILGREIFDGDEMLEVTPSEDTDYHGGGRRGDGGDVEKNAAFVFGRTIKSARAMIPLRRRKRPANTDLGADATAATRMAANATGVNTMTVPQTRATPPSRSDTASAASTVYAVRYHNLTSPSPGAPAGVTATDVQPPAPEIPKEVGDSATDSGKSTGDEEPKPDKPADRVQVQAPLATGSKQFWSSMANPFKRRRAEPPAEVAGAQIASGMRRSPIDRAVNLRDRFGAFANAQKERFGGRNASEQVASLPVTVIPAPKANERTWSPQDVRESGHQPPPNPEPAPPPAETAPADDESTPGDVVIIPAPTEGRTWSPPDRHDPAKPPSKTNSSNSRRSKDNSTPASQRQSPAASTSPNRNTPPNRTTPGSMRTNVVSTPRGSLMISEDTSRLSPPLPVAVGGEQSPRRSIFTRPVSISPISERLAESPAPAGGTPPLQSAPVEGTSPPAPAPARSSPAREPEPQGRATTADDSRDSGGTDTT
jgi:hypothetical protein